MLFDTHAHYDDDSFDEDREAVLAGAREQGVGLIVSVGTDIESSEKNIAIAAGHDYIYASVGCHPHCVEGLGDDATKRMRELAGMPKVVAIGEIGLDYHYDNSPRDAQKEWFARQLALARELGLPVIIHDREAHEDTMDILRSGGAGSIGGVFHCYSGSAQMAQEILKMGFYISFTGAITFKNAKKAPEVIKIIPDDRILIETDCPYLTPEPFRKNRNDSGYVRLVAERIAEIRGTSVERIAEITAENGKRLFGIA